MPHLYWVIIWRSLDLQWVWYCLVKGRVRNTLSTMLEGWVTCKHEGFGEMGLLTCAIQTGTSSGLVISHSTSNPCTYVWHFSRCTEGIQFSLVLHNNYTYRDPLKGGSLSLGCENFVLISVWPLLAKSGTPFSCSHTARNKIILHSLTFRVTPGFTANWSWCDHVMVAGSISIFAVAMDVWLE